MSFKQFLLFAFLSFKKNNYYTSISKKNKATLIDWNDSGKKNITENITENNINNISSYQIFLQKPVINVKPYIPKGTDERFNNTQINNNNIIKILDNYERKKILDVLTNSNISDVEKLKLIKNNDYLSKINSNQIKGMKMLNGGLMKDWNTKM